MLIKLSDDRTNHILPKNDGQVATNYFLITENLFYRFHNIWFFFFFKMIACFIQILKNRWYVTYLKITLNVTLWGPNNRLAQIYNPARLIILIFFYLLILPHPIFRIDWSTDVDGEYNGKAGFRTISKVHIMGKLQVIGHYHYSQAWKTFIISKTHEVSSQWWPCLSVQHAFVILSNTCR